MEITDVQVDAITLTFKWKNRLIGLGQIEEIVDEKMLDELSYINNKSIKQEILMNSHTSSSTLSRLARDENPKICALVASHPNTESKVLVGLSKKDFWTIQLEVAKNPHTPPYTLSMLSKNIDIRIRSAVARNPSAYAETLIYILGRSIVSGEKDVLVSLASNPNAPYKVFEVLYTCKYDTVRRAIANNPNLPVRFIKRLSKDPDMLVRKGIIKNSSVSKTVLNALLKTENNKILYSMLARRLAS